jgi:hypothetical protein
LVDCQDIKGKKTISKTFKKFREDLNGKDIKPCGCYVPEEATFDR